LLDREAARLREIFVAGGRFRFCWAGEKKPSQNKGLG
jgi:hypothetical protein